jgi:pre-mRNA-splicing factor RBM22/SLT11
MLAREYGRLSVIGRRKSPTIGGSLSTIDIPQPQLSCNDSTYSLSSTLNFIMNAIIKRDDNKQKWEDTEFPLACETCLGDNPYIRMTKEPFGKQCQVCERPFTVFAWQAGTKGRMKRVEICKSCAQAKNVCQVCIYDLQYGLPVKVRDKILKEHGSAGAITAVPQSMANRAWYTAQQERTLAQGGNSVGEANALAVAKLEEMANMEPRYERNMAKLCSFFAKGECNRGANCPFRHEMPRDRNDPMAKQNTKNRFFGSSDPVANKILGRQRRKEEETKKEDEDGYDKARATLYLRFQGDEPYPALTESNIRDQLYSFGEIASVRVQADRGQAFVEYTQPEAAELAIASMNRKSLLDRTIYVKWARAPKRGEDAVKRRGEETGAARPTVTKALAPPGGASKARIPKGLSVVKPPAHVAAMAAARRQRMAGGSSGVNVPRPGSSLPRPGGGPVRGIGKRPGGPSKPYYPSADPSRLGSKGTDN